MLEDVPFDQISQFDALIQVAVAVNVQQQSHAALLHHSVTGLLRAVMEAVPGRDGDGVTLRRFFEFTVRI